METRQKMSNEYDRYTQPGDAWFLSQWECNECGGDMVSNGTIRVCDNCGGWVKEDSGYEGGKVEKGWKSDE